MVKLSSVIVEIEGKEGGIVWRKDQCGQHIQAMPRTWNHPITVKQSKWRKAFFVCTHYAFHYLSTEHIKEWMVWTLSHKRVSRKGVIYYMTWWQAFISVNCIRQYNGQPLFESPSQIVP